MPNPITLTCMRPKRALSALGVVALVAALAACASSTASTTVSPGSVAPANCSASLPAPSDPMGRTRAAGLEPDTQERLTIHIHAHLDLFVCGKPVTVPAGIGINTKDPKVNEQDDSNGPAYYLSNGACADVCISPLHTHSTNGKVHLESSTATVFTLGQLFQEWNLRLDSNCVVNDCAPGVRIQVLVNGKKSTGNPADIELSDFKEIVVIVGQDPDQVPSTYDFNQGG